ncbi:uncharacterized protein [Littorina saxatilis]|uniref:Uncharacterized protein n=1 Tax=Littorina saxatilis TaxID=31220 RepID=A0AAN9BI93_9CAEN
MGCGNSKVSSVVELRSGTPASDIHPKSQGYGQAYPDKSVQNGHIKEHNSEAERRDQNIEVVRETEDQHLLEEAQQQRVEEATETEGRDHEETGQELEAEELAKAAEEERRRQEQLALALSQSVSKPDDVNTVSGRTFTPPQIAEHNAQAGWVEWIPHRGKVYDGNNFQQHFIVYMENRPVMLEARAQRRVAEGEDEEETEFKTYYPLNFFNGMPNIKDVAAMRNSGVTVLRSMGISEEELMIELQPFLLGTITGRSGPSYWSTFRSEVNIFLDDLKAEDEKDEDFVATVTRWQDKYGVVDPPEHPPPCDGVDPNSKSYPMPVDPESLRLWVLDFTWDCELPPEGAWHVIENDPEERPTTHEDLSEMLRPELRSRTDDLDFEIEGEAAWEVLPDSVIKDGVMTSGQEEIQASRDKRTDLDDPERMKKRREELCEHFISERELAPALVMAFMQWATVMDQNMVDLQKLSDQ